SFAREKAERKGRAIGFSGKSADGGRRNCWKRDAKAIAATRRQPDPGCLRVAAGRQLARTGWARPRSGRERLALAADISHAGGVRRPRSAALYQSKQAWCHHL